MDTLKDFDDLKTSKRSVWSNVFWYVKLYIFWKFIKYTTHWDKTQMLKKSPSKKINVTKNALSFLLRAPAHHSFNFNLLFIYELKHMVHLSISVCGIFHLQLQKLYIFVQKKAWAIWLKNVKIPFKIKIIEKPHTLLLPDLLFLNWNKKFGNSMISDLEMNIKNLQNLSFE